MQKIMQNLQNAERRQKRGRNDSTAVRPLPCMQQLTEDRAGFDPLATNMVH